MSRRNRRSKDPRIEGWRLLKTRHAGHAFDGEGARLFGGRWNSPGRPAVYLAANLALAILEILVNLEDTDPLPAYSQARASFGASLVERLPDDRLPADWALDPIPTSTRALGDAWLREARSVVLQVPSAVIASDWIFVVNPRHPDFEQVELGPLTPFQFDPRLRSAGS